MNRREFLAGVTGGAALLSGCSTSNVDTGDGEQGSIDPPVVGQLDHDRWTRVSDSSAEHTRDVSFTEVTAHERTRMWENEALRTRLKEWTLGNFDETVMMFFASRLEFEGLLGGGVQVSHIEDIVLPEFEAQLEEHNLEQMQKTSSEGVTPDMGDRSRNHEYTAQHPVPTFSRDMDIEEVGMQTIELEGGSLSVTGLLSIWREGYSTGFVAGGIFPAENYSASDTVSLSGGETGQGIDTTVSIDLRLTPSRYREEVVALIESVS